MPNEKTGPEAFVKAFVELAEQQTRKKQDPTYHEVFEAAKALDEWAPPFDPYDPGRPLPTRPFRSIDADIGRLIDYLIVLVFVAGGIDRLQPLEGVRFGAAADAADQSIAMLRILNETMARLNAESSVEGVSLLDYPEFMLVERLRLLNVSWAKIGEAVGINAPGMHKRWAEVVARYVETSAAEE